MSMLKSSLYDYGDAYLLVKGAIIVTGEGDYTAARKRDERNEEVVFQNLSTIH